MGTISREAIIEKVCKTSEEQRFVLHGVNLFLNKYTLVPHSDTFELIDIATSLLQTNTWISTIADVGTGSGVISIGLGKACPGKKLFASEISEEALNVAVKNARLNDVDAIQFLLNVDGRWLSEFGDTKIDCIVSNPPFVSKEEYSSQEFLLAYPETQLEPEKAVLAPGIDGLDPYLEILRNSTKNRTRWYLFQCNGRTIGKLKELITNEFKNYKITVKKNRVGLDRFMLIENPKM